MTPPGQSLDNTPDIVATTPALNDEAQLAALNRAHEAQANVVSQENPGPSPQRRLNSYLVKFNAQRSSLAVPGVNPHVRIIDFQSD